MKRRIILLVTFLSAILITIIVFLIIHNSKSPKKYSNIISLKNIESIEYRTNTEEGPYTNPTDYITLTSDEVNKFITNLKKDDYKYKPFGKNGEYKGIYDDRFVIHYSDGSTTYFGKYHVNKLDKNGNRTYFKVLIAYECIIADNLFK